MESHGVIFFYDKCRLCLDKQGAEDIFKTGGGLSQDIHACTGVKVSCVDNLPQKICSECLEIVTSAKKLRLLATTNDVYLRTLFTDDDDQLKIDESDDVSNKRDSYVKNMFFEFKEKNNETCNTEAVNENSQDETDNNETTQVKVRKDLFEPSSSTNPQTKVHTKEEYKSMKKKFKFENDLDTINFACEICSKTFETWKKLYLHSRVHNKNVVCPLDECGKKFATKGDLEKHLRTHTGVRPYVCDVCDKSFTQQGTLRVHKETVHSIFNLPP